MDKLTDLQREVVTLRFAAGLSIAETAKAVGRKENAVKALQHAGIRKLRDALDSAQRRQTHARRAVEALNSPARREWNRQTAIQH